MPKAKLEFNLPEEEAEFKLACSAGSLHSALWEMQSFLRSKVKYGGGDPQSWEEVQEEFFKCLNNRNIEL